MQPHFGAALRITDFDWGSLSAAQLISPPKETLTTRLSVAYPPLLTPSTLTWAPLREAEESQETVGPSLLPQLITSSAHPSTFSRGNAGSNGVYHTCHQQHHPLSRSIHGLYWWSSRFPQPDTAQTVTPVEPHVEPTSIKDSSLSITPITLLTLARLFTRTIISFPWPIRRSHCPENLSTGTWRASVR